MPKFLTFLAIGLSFAAATSAAIAADGGGPTKTALPASHPLVGAWRVEVPGTDCHEVYDIHADGTMDVTSGDQVAASEFEISVKPSPKGFFKWVDKIVKDNGRPDCMGEVMEVGHVATNFILLLPTKRQFLLCEAEDIKTCIGPFKRLGSDV